MVENILVLLDVHQWGQVVRGAKPAYSLPSIKDATRDLDSMLEEIKDGTTDDELNYWDWTAPAGIKLCRLMLDYKNSGVKLRAFDEACEMFRDTWERAGSKGKKLGEIDHFEFLIDALSLSRKKNVIAMTEKIRDMKTKLEQMI